MGLGEVSENVTFELRHNLRFDTIDHGIGWTKHRVEDLVYRVQAQRPESGEREQLVRCGNCPVVAVYRLLSIRDTQRLRLRQRVKALLAVVVAVVLIVALPWSDLIDYTVLVILAGLAVIVLAFTALIQLVVASDETGALQVRERGKGFLPSGHWITIESR